MWNANLIQLEKQNDSIRAVVVFDDGVKYKVQKDLFLNDITTLVSVCRQTAIKLEALYSNTDKITLGPIDLSDTTIPPTQEELDKQAFFRLVGKKENLKRSLSPDHQDIIKAQADVDAAYKAEYFD